MIFKFITLTDEQTTSMCILNKYENKIQILNNKQPHFLKRTLPSYIFLEMVDMQLENYNLPPHMFCQGVGSLKKTI